VININLPKDDLSQSSLLFDLTAYSYCLGKKKKTKLGENTWKLNKKLHSLTKQEKSIRKLQPDEYETRKRDPHEEEKRKAHVGLAVFQGKI